MRDSLEHRGLTMLAYLLKTMLVSAIEDFQFLMFQLPDINPFFQITEYVMVYNGEIYNFKDFYPELKVADLSKQVLTRKF
jgi:asparagine synthase (glutamine-hydrolysing)